MKLGILSDTHDQCTRCEQAVSLLQAAGAEAIVHCGDLTEANIIEICAVVPFYFVLGNNDYDNVPMLQQMAARTGTTYLELGGVIGIANQKIAVTHGHLTSEVRRLLALQPDYLLSGHTHVAEDRVVDRTRRINPGALHRARNFTVAVLDLISGELIFIPVVR
jgi:putative phosphoesterase